MVGDRLIPPMKGFSDSQAGAFLFLCILGLLHCEARARKLDTINFPLENRIKSVEDGLIDFFPSTGGYISNWFEFIHENAEFRERVKARYRERMDYCKRDIKALQDALKAMDNLASSKPNKEQMEYDKSLFVCLM